MSLPLPKRSWGTGTFKPGDTVSLFTNESGIVGEPLRTDGERIEIGDAILTLRNPELLKEKLKLQSALEQADAKLKSMDGEAYHNTQVWDQKGIEESRFRAIKIQVEEIDRRLESLNVKAKQSGYLKLMPPTIENDMGLLKQASYQSNKQQGWLTSLPTGIALPKNSLIGEIVTSDDPHIECEISKEQTDFISVGTPVVFRLSVYPDKILKGIVSKVSSAVVTEFKPRAIASNTGTIDTRAVKHSEHAIGKVLLRIDCDELQTLHHAHGHAELMFHHFDQSMWDYIVDAVLRNTRWR
jgi:multidrug resistance efflux pump